MITRVRVADDSQQIPEYGYRSNDNTTQLVAKLGILFCTSIITELGRNFEDKERSLFATRRSLLPIMLLFSDSVFPAFRWPRLSRVCE